MTYQFEIEPNHWFFHRDEVDVLEEEIEDIYVSHRRAGCKMQVMEHKLIEEQMLTEAGSDLDEMSSQDAIFDAPLFDQEEIRQDMDMSLDEYVSVLEHLRHLAQRDELYSLTYVWSREVFEFARDRYVSGEDRSKEMFRVYLNVNMIPVKLSVASVEEVLSEPASVDLARREYEFAVIYLERTLDSLEKLIDRGYVFFLPFIRSGIQIRKLILRAIDTFGRV
jgi:hypothetical protein